MKSMSVIITSYHQKELTLNCIKSYLRFCPSNLNLKLIIVENSDDVTYKKDVLLMGNNIIWINNITHHRGANANANGVEVGMRYVDDEYVFLSHNDVCITSFSFFTSIIEKVQEGYRLIGTCYDTHPARNHSIIILGCLVESKIVREVDLYPLNKPDGSPYFECGDRIHIYCLENNIKHMCFRNTHNNEELVSELSVLYQNLNYTVRTVDHYNNLIFLHFARGTDKTIGRYKKKGRLGIPQIVQFCNDNIFNENRI